MHLLYKVQFWTRREIIFCRKNITKSHAIILLGKAGHGSKNIQELFQNFWSDRNGGCFGALVSEIGLRRENEYFSFRKNIHLVILGIFREMRLKEK